MTAMCLREDVRPSDYKCVGDLAAREATNVARMREVPLYIDFFRSSL